MTVSEVSPEALDAAFEFARRQREPKFRQYLKNAGWQTRGGTVVAEDDEPIFSVLHRIIFNGASSPCLIAIIDDNAPFGYKLMVAEVATHKKLLRMVQRWRGREFQIKPNTTVGMIYSSLQGCGQYVPNEWTQPVMFERLAA